MIIPFNPNWQDFPCKVYEGYINDGGYGSKGSTKAGDPTSLVHRQEWIKAYGDITPQEIVMHACDIPACYAVEHLGLGTHSDNNADMVSKNRQAKGSQHGMSRLVENEVVQVKRMLAAGMSCTSIAARFNVTMFCIFDIKRGKTWNHVDVSFVRKPLVRRFTESDVVDIKTLLALPDAPSMSEIARQYKVSSTMISYIRSGKSWGHVKIGCEF